MKKRLLVIALAALLAAGGCGGDDEAAGTDTTTITGEPELTTDVSVYWLLDGKVWPALRDARQVDAVEEFALDALLAGPTEQEAQDMQFATAIPEGTEVDELSIEDGAAQLELSAELPDEALAQVTYTLLGQFLTVESLEVQGRTVTRADFEDLTPAILVESPLPFEEVSSPIQATGTANAFEATFSYEVTDTDGRIVDEDFVTATSGTGTRGTFNFTTEEFTIPFDGIGELIVFELSAKDGSRINLVEIPLKMSK